MKTFAVLEEVEPNDYAIQEIIATVENEQACEKPDREDTARGKAPAHGGRQGHRD